MSIREILSTALSILALSLSVFTYLRGERMKKREDLRQFLSRTLYLSERVGRELLVTSVYFRDEATSDPAIAQRLYDIGVMPQISELIEFDTSSSRWRDQDFYRQFSSLVTSLKDLEGNCVLLVRERGIASEAEMVDLLKKIVQDSRNYDEIARARLLKL
jgi:hypothetical protein